MCRIVIGIFLSIAECPDGQFQCRNKQCINMLYRCDGRVHCSDRSDEDDCREYKLLFLFYNFSSEGFQLMDLKAAIHRRDTRIYSWWSNVFIIILLVWYLNMFEYCEVFAEKIFRYSRVWNLHIMQEPHIVMYSIFFFLCFIDFFPANRSQGTIWILQFACQCCFFSNWEIQIQFQADYWTNVCP